MRIKAGMKLGERLDHRVQNSIKPARQEKSGMGTPQMKRFLYDFEPILFQQRTSSQIS